MAERVFIFLSPDSYTRFMFGDFIDQYAFGSDLSRFFRDLAETNGLEDGKFYSVTIQPSLLPQIEGRPYLWSLVKDSDF